jgi:hypothetical protein
MVGIKYVTMLAAVKARLSDCSTSSIRRKKAPQCAISCGVAGRRSDGSAWRRATITATKLPSGRDWTVMAVLSGQFSG